MDVYTRPAVSEEHLAIKPLQKLDEPVKVVFCVLCYLHFKVTSSEHVKQMIHEETRGGDASMQIQQFPKQRLELLSSDIHLVNEELT